MRVLYLIEGAIEWIGKIASFLLLIIIAIMFYEVVMRHILHSPTMWATEMSSYILGVYVLLGGAYTLVHNEHVNVDILYNKFSKKGQFILDLFSYPLLFAFAAALIYKGGQFFLTSFRGAETSGTVFNPPLYPVKFFVPFAGLLIFITGIHQLMKKYKNLSEDLGGQK